MYIIPENFSENVKYIMLIIVLFHNFPEMVGDYM